jgi:signal transduction histidine kinase
MPNPEHAQERARQLQLLTQRLAGVLSLEEIGATVIGQAHEYLGASGSVAYVRDDAGTPRLVAHRGISDELAGQRATLPFDADNLPLARAIRTGASLWFTSRAELVREFPMLADSDAALDATAALPLVFGGRTLGGIAFSFRGAVQLDPATRDLVETFALQCAQAVERARLYEGERRARRRLEVLAETGENLTRARLDLAAVLQTVCREVATRMPESCTINLIAGDGTLELAAVHHIDPEAEQGIRMTLAATPVHVGESALGIVAATGEPLLMPVVPFEALLAGTRPEYRLHLERYPIGSLLIVPLRVPERVIGTLTASRGRSRPPFTLDDQRLLQDLADRSAFAIENARLFEAELHARRLRDDFLSIAGHELRTPLAALQLQIQSIQGLATKGTFAAEPALLVARLDKTVRHVQRMEGLVAQLLDVSQLARGRLELVCEPVEVRALIGEVLERFAEQARRAECELALAAGEPVVGNWDRSRLDQVLTNVIGNALKYGAGKPIAIRVERAGERCRIEVRDHGIGIERDAQQRIFGRFERAMSVRNYGGLGLGLWISRQIVDALGGHITCDSAPGMGTTFAIELPLGREAP